MNEFYKKKLQKILKLYEDNHVHFYFLHTKAELSEFVNKFIENNEIENDYQFMYFIRLILKKMCNIYDSHTRIRLSNQHNFPMKFKIIENEIYVISTSEEYKQYLYYRLKGLNNISIDKIIEEVKKSICYSTQGYLEREIENYLSTSSVFMLPSIQLNNKILYNLENDETTINVNIDVDKSYDVKEKSNENFSYKINNDYIIFIYNSCIEPKKDYMKNTINKLKKELGDKKISKFIVDLRGNAGGSSEIINPLIDYLSQNDYEIITLVDKYVFSSGRFAIFKLQKINSKFVGTEIGTSMNCFGQCNTMNLKLKNIEVTLTSSEKYFYYLNPNTLSQAISKEEIDSLPKSVYEPIYFQPDIYVTENIENIMKEKDIFLETALSMTDPHINKI